MQTNQFPPASIHADLHSLIFLLWTVQTHFHLIKVDMDDFFTICANLRHLSIKIDRISTTRTTGNHNTNDLCFLLHGKQSFLKCLKMGKNLTSEWFCIMNINNFL